MQYQPQGWTAGDLNRFNALIDACFGYMIFDYAISKVAPTNNFLSARRTDIANLITQVLGPAFINDWNT